MDTIPTMADGRPGDRSIFDAVAIRRAGRHSKHLPMVRPDDEMVALKLLSDRRHALVASRTQSMCRLHRLIGELIPGGTPRALPPNVQKPWSTARTCRVRPNDADRARP
jgi:hypothetical protein